MLLSLTSPALISPGETHHCHSFKLMHKESAANAREAGDTAPIPGLGRFPGVRNDYACPILAWRIPWTEEPSGLQSMELQRVGHDCAT